MISQSENTVVAIGATGQQGKGVVRALKSKTQFKVRAVTRNPEKYIGEADEVVSANLDDLNSLVSAFENAYGVFVVTNFWENGTDEISQAENAIAAAKTANIKHFIWSTLPDVEKISKGKFHVPHFTDKAKVDELVTTADFPRHTFVVASFFYQNLLTNMAPQQLEEGTQGWILPISAESKSIHMTDINELGDAVAGAFTQPEKAGQGEYLPVVGDILSFGDIINILNNHGNSLTFQEVPIDVFSSFFPGADELAQMFGYFENYTYMGGEFDSTDFKLEQEISERQPIGFSDWAATNWK